MMIESEHYPAEMQEIAERLNSIPVLRRYESRPLPDIVPLVFVLYAAYKDFEIQFDDGRLMEPSKEHLGGDWIFGKLYKFTISQLDDGAKCREAEELHISIAPLRGDLYKRVFPSFIENYIVWRDEINWDWPIETLEQIIGGILSDQKSSSIYEYGSGLGLLSGYYDGWERYCTYERSRTNQLFDELLKVVRGKRRVDPASREYFSMPSMMDGFDTVVVRLIGQYAEDFRSPKELGALFENLLALDSWRLAVIMVTYDFCVGAEYEAMRRAVCEKGVLETVIETEPPFIYGEPSRFSILVLNSDRKEGSPIVFEQHIFNDSEKVSLEQLRSCHYVFESMIYKPDSRSNPGKSAADEVTVPLGSLLKQFACKEKLTEEGVEAIGVTADDYESGVSRIISPKKPHKLKYSPRYKDRNYLTGPAVSLLFEKKSVRVCRLESKSSYIVPRNSISFIPSDSADTSYFILVLYRFGGLEYPLQGIRNMVCLSNLEIGSPALPERYLAEILAALPVRAVLGKERQAEEARRIIRDDDAVVRTDMEYGVVIVGAPLSDVERGDLPSWKVNVLFETDGVKGPGSLEEILENDSEKPIHQADAVFFDVTVGCGGDEVGYDGLFDAMEVVGKDMPLVIFSDVSLESFDRMEMRMFNRLKKDNHIFVFKKDVNAVMNAVRDLRDLLDSKKSPERGVKMKYSEELGLAESIDPSGDMAVNLVKALRGEFEDVEDPKEVSERIGLLRKGAETVFNNAKERGLLPPLTFLGAMQQFLADGEYFDNGTMRYYRLTEKVMPETLSCALDYFVTIVNGGMHARQEGKLDVIGYISRVARSTNVYRSCAFILMDLLKWYGSLNADGPLYEETAPFRDDDLVKKVRNGNQDYYYIGCVHLKYSPGLVEGIPGRDIKFKRVSLEKYPAPAGVGNEIRYFLTEYRIDR